MRIRSFADKLFIDYGQCCCISVPMFSTQTCRQVGVFIQCPDVSKETTLQLIGTLDVACIATQCPLFTVTRVGSLTINSRPVFHGRTDRMYTMYVLLAGIHTPYFPMGLGIYYIATPETFAFYLKTGIEPATSSLWDQRSNQLNYFAFDI